MSRTKHKYAIYGLRERGSERIRYVGKMTYPDRPRVHGQPAYMERHKQLPVVCWIRSLRERGGDYEWILLAEHASADQLYAAECEWIAKFGLSNLLNCTNGGEGRSGHRLSPETRAKIAVARRGKPAGPASEERKRRISEALTGKAKTEAHRTRLAAAARRQPRVHGRFSEAP